MTRRLSTEVNALARGLWSQLVATGRVDAVEMIVYPLSSHLEYYRYRYAGYRLPLVGRTDKLLGVLPSSQEDIA